MIKQKWEEKKINLGNAIIFAVAFLVIGVVVGVNWNGWFGKVVPIGATSSGTDWSSLDEVYSQLNSSYNGEISQEDLLSGAKTGMVAALGDVYTEYMDEEESDDFTDALHGKAGVGIGVEMGLRDGYVRVLRVLPDNPALRAGIMPGDIFYKINGEEVYMMGTAEIKKRLAGEAGTEVTVAMARDGKEMEFKLVREEINNVSEYVTYDGDTAIVTVLRFDTDTGTKVQAEAAQFAEKGVKKVILDLRGNGGGYVSAARDLLSLWLDGQKVLVQKSKHFGTETISTSSGKAILKDMKTVVLVNASTASASEITAAALKEHGKATIVGEKTYGKGVVQKLYSLSDGGLLKVTIAEWLTPNENSIDGNGVVPDVTVERTSEDINKMRDPQMDKAKAL
ncbi:S41 family peptidase [Candidatus Saccharibacteria bacterium]|nr:S41 family peptidase [Candidatus Saccharibacteria bacterium]